MFGACNKHHEDHLYFYVFGRESIPCCFNKFQGKEFNPNKSIKFIFEKYPWHEGLCIFAISDISTCDWCGGRDGGCSSLDCYTCDSPWYCFLFSSAIFLRDIMRCETPGMYKWVPGLSGWEGSAGWLPFILQLTRPLKFCCSVGFLTINIRWLKVMAPEIRFGP